MRNHFDKDSSQSPKYSLFDEKEDISKSTLLIQKKQRNEQREQTIQQKLFEKRHNKKTQKAELYRIERSKKLIKAFCNLSKEDTEQISQETRKFPQIDQSNTILYFALMGEYKQLCKKQKKLRQWNKHFVMKMGLIIFSIVLLYMFLLKTFFFFSNQVSVAMLESFKEQLFDPHVTNDDLQLEIFYISEGCFLLTIVIVFLFIVMCIVLVNRYYMKRLKVYRWNKTQIQRIEESKDKLFYDLRTTNLDIQEEFSV